MEEITSFEERLTNLKQKGDDLVASCTDEVQAKINQQVQSHQQGTRDSYAAICSTAQRVSHSSLTQIVLKYNRYNAITLNVFPLFNRSTRALTENCRNMSAIRTLSSSVKHGSSLYRRSFS